MFLLWCKTLYSCKNFVLKRIKCYFNPELFVIDTVNWYKYVIGFCVVQFMIVGVEISILPCGTCSDFEVTCTCPESYIMACTPVSPITITNYVKGFEPRSHFKSRLSLIVQVNVVLNRTVVVDSD